MSRQIFELSSDFKFHENPNRWSRVVLCRQMATHDEAHTRFLQFCENRIYVAHINQSDTGNKQSPTQGSEAHTVRGPNWCLQISGGIHVIKKKTR